MNRRTSKLLLSAAVALCFSVAPVAQATILSSFLTFDGPVHNTFPPIQGGGEDKLQDDSLSKYLPGANNTTGTFQVGDTILGMLTLSEVLASGRASVPLGGTGAGDKQVMILFSASITSLAGPGGSIVLGATAAGTNDLATICGAVCTGVAGIGANSIAVVLSTAQNTASSANDPLNWDYAGANGYTGNINGANGNGPWGWEATLGLTPGTGDFFQFFGNLALGGSERGAFTIESSAFEVKDWLPVDVLDFAANYRTGDATLDVGTVQLASTDEQSRGWTFRDQASLFVNPIPEPGSLALMGIALAGLGGMARRRRQQ